MHFSIVLVATLLSTFLFADRPQWNLQSLNFVPFSEENRVEFQVSRVEKDSCLELRTSFGYPSGAAKEIAKSLIVTELSENGIEGTKLKLDAKSKEFPLYFIFPQAHEYGINIAFYTTDKQNFSDLFSKSFETKHKVHGAIRKVTCPK